MRKAIRQIIYGRPYEVGKGTVAGHFHGGETSNERKIAVFASAFSMLPKNQLKLAGNFSCTNCEGMYPMVRVGECWVSSRHASPGLRRQGRATCDAAPQAFDE